MEFSFAWVVLKRPFSGEEDPLNHSDFVTVWGKSIFQHVPMNLDLRNKNPKVTQIADPSKDQGRSTSDGSTSGLNLKLLKCTHFGININSVSRQNTLVPFLTRFTHI